MWEFDFYQNVYAKNGSTRLSDTTPIYTGQCISSGGGAVTSNASTNIGDYDPNWNDASLPLYSNCSSFSKIYLRIENPKVANYLNNYQTIQNMKTWGWFQK